MNDIVPTEFFLGQNFPNPFNDKTKIKYCVAYKTRVKLTVFDSEGEVKEKLVDEEKNAGTYEVEFSVDRQNEMSLISKKYFYRLEAGNYSEIKKMVLINDL